VRLVATGGWTDGGVGRGGCGALTDVIVGGAGAIEIGIGNAGFGGNVTAGAAGCGSCGPATADGFASDASGGLFCAATSETKAGSPRRMATIATTLPTRPA
jgi:hypothetical protein